MITDPPPGLVPSLHARLTELIVRSLGDPRYYAVASNKFLLADAAHEAGVQVPDQRIVMGPAAAIDAGREFGYPMVLKRAVAAGGETVRIVEDEHAVASFAAQASSVQMLAQKYIHGRHASFGAVSLSGRLLAGITAIRLGSEPSDTGPGTVVQLADRADLTSGRKDDRSALGFLGSASCSEATGTAYLIGLSRISVSNIGTFLSLTPRELYRALVAAG